MTSFDGFVFEAGGYDQEEAKALLSQAMHALGKHEALQALGVDPSVRKRRVGKGLDVVWDVFRFSPASGYHTSEPHLTLGLSREGVTAMVTLPNGAVETPLSPLLAGGLDGFVRLVKDILRRMRARLADCAGMAPRIRIHQRHWPQGRGTPIYDASLNADLRALRGDTAAEVKRLPIWIDAAFQVIEAKEGERANVELQMGAAFPFATCPTVEEPGILDHIAAAWIACRPFIEKLGVDLPSEAEGT